MADRLTQLQDAADQLAQQFVACIYYVNKHHDLLPVNAADKPREGIQPTDTVEPHLAEEFAAGQRELARDLVLREQQIELLISSLPGLENSEENQQERILFLEEELRKEEDKRKAAVEEKKALLTKLETVIRSVKRP